MRMTKDDIQIIAFYEFKLMDELGDLTGVRQRLKDAFREIGVRGTIILAHEGYNGMVCGSPDEIRTFIPEAEKILDTELSVKSSFYDRAPFRKIDVKIKPEIVTLKKPIDIALGKGTHVEPADWNSLIADPETLVLDARNDYEYKTGTFRGAVNPQVRKFSDLPAFVTTNLDPQRYKRIATFCTGGIRCEKLAPYLKEVVFSEVYQLSGGILRYLAETSPDKSLWEGECFVFDERITLDHDLTKGSTPDHSQRHPDSGDKRS